MFSIGLGFKNGMHVKSPVFLLYLIMEKPTPSPIKIEDVSAPLWYLILCYSLMIASFFVSMYGLITKFIH